MFYGQAQHSIDQKNRIILPAKYRELLGEEFYVVLGFDPCLCIYTEESYKNFEEKITMDFTDVRDVVRAYRIMMEKGAATNVYQIGSPVRLKMRELLEKVATEVGVDADCEVDEALWRPTDESPELNTEPLRLLGWQPQISIERTISDIVERMQNDIS